ncbi:MAG: hypothetical protein JWO89_1639 [Verrucomicrobiaceae bacterium]|nr:hypothetical protein [Verrucomicrobiaceae bacterium]
MDQRQSFINLIITVAIIGTVAAAALVFRNRTPHLVPIKREELKSAATTPAADTSAKVVERPVEKSFLTFPKVQLVDVPANQADTLRIHLPDGDHVFTHYFIHALDNSADHLDRVNETAVFFGRVSNDAVIATGKEAMAYVTDLLKNHPFMVLTRWEKAPEAGRYYALIWVEYEKGKWKYLSELLVRHGYARIAGVTTPLPNTKVTEDDYIQLLQSGAKYARQNKLGIWAKAKK